MYQAPVFIKATFVVDQRNMTPNDAIPKSILLPIDAIAALVPFSGGTYNVILKKDYQFLMHERYEAIRVSVTPAALQIMGQG